jgi:hypothetical protein
LTVDVPVSDHRALSALPLVVGAVNFAPDVEAFLGGVGVGLSVFFIALLCTMGVGVIRRMLG